MRPPIFRGSFLRADELVVDNFAGGGGASTGIEQAIGRPVDLAINHDAEAIALHAANHPGTRHFCEDVWEVDPVVACGGRPVGIAWFSPDCTHFSRAKGTAPVSQGIRGLAWVVIRWAKAVRPRVIVLENVEEFQTWGPLDGQRPDQARAGETFRAWLAQLTELGYRVEFRALVAADFGAPTTRRRLFLVARCDGGAIRWPEPTHGRGTAQPWRSAAEIIDWELPCPSIFERERPLAEATLRRIAAGIQRYIVDDADPFIVPGSQRGELAAPFVVRHGHYSKRTGAGLRPGCGAGTFRGQNLELPLGTVCATNDKHLVAPVLLKHYGGVVGHRADRTLGTVTARDHHSLALAELVREPARHDDAVRAFLVKYYGSLGKEQGQRVREPLHTITTKARFGLVTLRGEPYRIVDIGMRMLQPAELFAAQGFPRSYEIAPVVNGKPLTKTAQTRLAGNSVCPPNARAVVAAQLFGDALQGSAA